MNIIQTGCGCILLAGIAVGVITVLYDLVTGDIGGVINNLIGMCSLTLLLVFITGGEDAIKQLIRIITNQRGDD